MYIDPIGNVSNVLVSVEFIRGVGDLIDPLD